MNSNFIVRFSDLHPGCAISSVVEAKIEDLISVYSFPLNESDRWGLLGMDWGQSSSL